VPLLSFSITDEALCVLQLINSLLSIISGGRFFSVMGGESFLFQPSFSGVLFVLCQGHLALMEL
jgi:hypothetical protein